ncbi:MAG: PQQ-binding-like beta-propeller repeat protein [Phycisphaerales bacterium]|jgi:outer membrane protein assembly factor BamB|nr:PQQ-binding-like beta-propeller repeat protein [Phycisphaerales bacterium]
MNKITVTFLGLGLLPCFAAGETAEVGLQELFGKAGDRPGAFVLHLHCGDGASTGRLLKREGVVLQGLDCDAENVGKARRNKIFRKDYGKRVTFNVFDGEYLPFIDNCVNVILSSKEIKVLAREIHRVLTPGGVAVFRSGAAPEISKKLATVTMIKKGYYRLAKLWPSDIDEWTHHMHGPDNNRVSSDTRIAPPLSHLQWTAGPRYTRHHEHMSSFQAMVSARGRVFYIIDEGRKDSVMLPSQWSLVARDGFNGIVLWRKKLDHWFDHLWTFKSGPVVVTRRLVVKGNRLFAALKMGGGVSILDASSGAVLHELPGTKGAEEIIVAGNRLILVKRQWLSKGSFPGHSRNRHKLDAFSWKKRGGRQSVIVFDIDTRKLLWEKQIPIAPLGVGSRDGQVYVFDGERVLSLGLDSGEETWTSAKFCKPNPYTPNYGSGLVCGKTRIMVGSISGTPYRGSAMVALSAKDGKVVWKGSQYASGRHSPKDLFLIDGKAWTASTFGASMTLPGVPSTAKRKSGRITGYNLADGKVASDFYTDSDVYIMNSRCHMSCATTNYFITSRTGVELVSTKDKSWHLHHWLRGACLYGLMPANGILYAPPNPCACYTQSSLDGFNAVTGYNAAWAKVVEKQKARDFVRGTAVSDRRVSAPSAVETQSWPVYRRDNKRSGSTPAKVALPLAVRWRTKGYENLTAPVAAAGCCVFAEKDRHTVHCLDAKSGKAQWSYVAGGRIDSPPAISGNSLYFGCGDGWLYRLAISTGKLVWKRRIAPASLSLFDHGQPASIWPLSGSVLVQDGKVYCLAGRSSFLDGGMRLTVVDAASGAVLKTNVMDHLDPDNGKDMHQHVAMQNLPVSLPDLLSSDGKNLYMRTQQFDLNGKRTHITNSAWDDNIKLGVGREHLFSPTGFLDDNWFHRSYWIYGNSFLEGCSMPSGGWFEMGRISPSGKILCFDDTTVYGYGQFPEYSKWSTPLRYSVFAMAKKPKSYKPGTPDAKLRKTRPNWRKYRTLRCPKVEFDFRWKSRIPLRAKAIVKTPDTLLVAGPEDVLDEEKIFSDPNSESNKALLRKQNELLGSPKQGKLLAVSVRDGAVAQTIDLASQPVWDGMAAAYGKLFVCCKDGSVVALGEKTTLTRQMPEKTAKIKP